MVLCMLPHLMHLTSILSLPQIMVPQVLKLGSPHFLHSAGISKVWGVPVWGGSRSMDVRLDSGFKGVYRQLVVSELFNTVRNRVTENCYGDVCFRDNGTLMLPFGVTLSPFSWLVWPGQHVLCGLFCVYSSLACARGEIRVSLGDFRNQIIQIVNTILKKCG